MQHRPTEQVGRAPLGPFSIDGCVIAALMFYFPLARFPPMPAIRRTFLAVPALGTNGNLFSPGIFLVPETVLTLFLLIRCVVARRNGQGHILSGSLRVIALAGLLMVTGGLVSLIGSDAVGYSVAELNAMVTVFILAWVIAQSAPTPSTISFWVVAALAGTSVLSIAGAKTFYDSCGIPTSLAILPVLRTSPCIVIYQKVTFGIASNTADFLIMVAPVSIALLLARRARWYMHAFLAIALILILINLLIDFERWAWICLAIALTLAIVYWRRTFRGGWLFLLVLLSGILLSGVVVSQLDGYFGSALNQASGSNLTRRETDWAQGLGLVLANPAGYGLGTLNTLPGLSDTAAHNFFIDLSVEGGILSLMGAGLWSFFCVKRLCATLLRPEPERDWVFALLLGPFTFLLFGIFFNSALYFYGSSVWLAYWWCLPAMAFAIQAPGEARTTEHRPREGLTTREPLPVRQGRLGIVRGRNV